MKKLKITKSGLFLLPLAVIITAFILNGCSNDNTTTSPTTKTYSQVDHVGKPAINTVFIGASDSTQKDSFNHTIPSQMSAAFYATVLARLMALNPGYTTNILTLTAAQFSTALVNDVLPVATVGPTTFYDGVHVLTGRQLTDDVIHIELILIFGGPNGMQNPGQNDDHVPTNDVTFSNTFPFLANPH